MQQAMDQLLTFNQTRKELGISSSTLRRWMNNRSITGHKFGGQWRFKKCDVIALVNGPQKTEQGEAL